MFATHYLEEADAYADRIVLMANGLVVADGSTTEIKARVGRRTIRATLPGVAVDRRWPRCPASSRPTATATPSSCRAPTPTRAIRALLAAHPDAHDIEIRGAALEDAFVELTTEHAPSRPVEVRS